MHRMIHRKDKTLPVRLSSVDVKVKVPRRRKLLVKPWPVLYMTDWARLCFENSKYNGFFFLGGNTLDTWEDAQAMLQTFWGRYKNIDPSLVPEHPSQTVPFYIHGDEGRGLGKRPLLVISFQPTMSWTGGQKIPSTKYLYSYKWLFVAMLGLEPIPIWPATNNLQILCPCTSEAYLHQPISVHGGAIWMLCPWRCNRWRSAWSSGVWPRSIGNWGSWGRVWKTMQ